MSAVAHNKLLALIFWLTLTALIALATGCSPAGEALPAAAPQQAPGGPLLQDAPPTPALKAVEIDTGQISPLDTDQLTIQGCPKVESQLGQVIHGPNPLEAARQLGIRVEGDRVQVLLVLNDEDVTFLQRFGAEVGKQSGTQVQAFVPLSRVCELASADNVLAIRLPGQAVIQ